MSCTMSSWEEKQFFSQFGLKLISIKVVANICEAHGTQSHCIDNHGSFTCECNDGFMMVEGLCEELNECLTSDHDCDSNAKVYRLWNIVHNSYPITWNIFCEFSVWTKNRDTAVSAKIIFMVMDMTAIILILVGINHANIETAHVTLSPIQFGCLFLTNIWTNILHV